MNQNFTSNINIGLETFWMFISFTLIYTELWQDDLKRYQGKQYYSLVLPITWKNLFGRTLHRLYILFIGFNYKTVDKQCKGNDEQCEEVVYLYHMAEMLLYSPLYSISQKKICKNNWSSLEQDGRQADILQFAYNNHLWVNNGGSLW